jgi:hypothetical protein
MRPLAVALLFLAPGFAYAAPKLPELTTPQSDYVEHCSGCHGMQGDSAPAEIPVLRDRIGYFMCLPEGREYLIRLPNVAYSAITDNQELADMMNFVVFGLGGNSAPKDAKPLPRRKWRCAPARWRPVVIAVRQVGNDGLRGAQSMNFFYDGQEQAGAESRNRG